MHNQSIRRFPVLLILAVLAAALLANSASATMLPESSKDAASDSNIVPGHYIVVLKDSVKGPATVARAQTEQKGGELGFVYRHALKGYSAKLSKGAVKALRNDPRVKRVDPVRRFEIASQTTPTGIERIFANSNKALDIDEEDDVRIDVDVAVIDTGIDYEHPDLNVVGRTNCVPPGKLEEPLAEDCVDGTGTDDHDHGTHVAGTIGALDNEEGVVGVAPGARLWAVKVLTPYIFGSAIGYTPWIVAGIDWVTATHQDEDPENDIEVANMSLGGEGPNPAFDEAIEGSVEAGVVYAVAAGNNSQNAKYFTPASSPDVITVSALADYDGSSDGEGEPTCSDRGPDDTLAEFSNWGKEVEIAAPGVCIFSTLPDGEYGTFSGTSMASPHVAGAAAILASESQPQSAEDVEAIRQQLLDEASLDWSDTSKDFYREPLLYLDDEAAPIEANTEMATKIGVSATLNGSIEARGLEATYKFEYGTTTSYGSSTSSLKLPPGSGYIKVSRAIGDLVAGTTYHYRLLVESPEGTIEGEDRTFIATPWSAQDPPAGPLDSIDEISCISGTECIAVGSEAIEFELEKEILGVKFSHYFVPAAYRLSSGKWEQLAAKNPGEKGHVFRDVSCTSATFCMAVGAGSIPPWTQHWDGSKWTVTSIEIPEDAKKDLFGNLRLDLRAVSCASATSCVAVGEYATAYGKNNAALNRSLIEVWDGKEWQAVSPPSGEPTEPQTQLDKVSCVASNSCVAVGSTKSYEEAKTRRLIVGTDNGEWSIEHLGGSGSGFFRGVSCVSASSCLAVGSSAMRWDGKAWTSISGAEKTTGDISCVTKSWCLAGGGMVVWNGVESKWIPQQLAVPLDQSGEEIERAGEMGLGGASAVSCVPAACMGLNESPQRLSITTAKTVKASGVLPTKATLNGIVNPHGGFATTYQFEYGPTTAYGTQVPVSPKWVGLGTKDVSVSESISGLEAGTTYHFRVVATGNLGSVYGEDLTFTTPAPPTATTKAASGIEVEKATLNGTVDPNALASTYQFEYGTTTAYGSKVPVSPKSVGSGTEGVKVAEAISGLKPGTTYHYRVVATNAEGTAYGKDATLTTKPDPRFAFDFGSPGSGNGQFSDAGGIAIDASGNVWVADSANARIQKFNSEGKYLSQFSSFLSYPTGIALDSKGNLWVADESSVKKFNSEGKYVSGFGSEGSGNGQFGWANDVAIDSSGNLWVVDLGNNRVQKFNSEGKYQSQFGTKGTGTGQFQEPSGIAIDGSGNLWVADSANSRVQKFNSEGKYQSQFGTAGTGNGQLKSPYGIDVDSTGNVWVADTGNARVQKFNSSGEYLAQFGALGAGEGQFEMPFALDADASGHVWVTDYLKNEVQKWVP